MSPARRARPGCDSLLAWLDDRFSPSRHGGKGDGPLAAILLAPSLVLLGLFGFLPLLVAVYLSLFGGKRALGPFVFLQNYGDALARPDFWNSFLVTLYYALGTIPVAMGLSFVVAYALRRIVRGRAFFRLLYFLPYVTSSVAAAMVWRALFNPQSGAFNTLLGWVGVGPQQWLLEPRGLLHLLSGGWIPQQAGPSLALCCIMAFDIWHSMGFMVVVFLAGLTAIPRELEDAARIDGAGAMRSIRHVVLPLLSPTLLFLLIVSTIRSFQAFNSFYAMTQGGRTLGTTENLVLHIYANFYEYGYWGYGAAVATLLCIAIVILSAVQWRYVGRRVHYR